MYMKITCAQYTDYNIYNKSSYAKTPTSKPTFKAHFDCGQVKELVGDGLLYQRGNIHNYSCLARDVQLFTELPQILEKKFPDGVKIYDYGCSAGYEPTSVVMGLFNHFPKDKVSKYTPIEARDNNPDIIKKAKEYKLRLGDDEMHRLNFFENIKQGDFLTASGKRKGRDGQKTFECSDKLKQDINYNTGDIFEDLKEGKLSSDPCVVFIRNAWQFMTQKGIKELSENLYSKLQPQSMVIIGRNDISKGADKELLRAGFKNISGNYNIKFKDKKLGAKYANSKGYPPETTNIFCFEAK